MPTVPPDTGTPTEPCAPHLPKPAAPRLDRAACPSTAPTPHSARLGYFAKRLNKKTKGQHQR